MNPVKQTVEQYTLVPQLEEYELASTFSASGFIESKQVAGFQISGRTMFN